jgi:hypothetical protein
MGPLHHCPVHATCAGAGQALQDGGGSRLSDHAREGPHRPITRRHLVVAGVLALGGVGLWRSVAAVATAVEVLRQAMVGQAKTSLEVLYAEQLSYGHADGRVEHTAQCITGVMTRKALLTSLTLSEHTTPPSALRRSHAIRGRLQAQPTARPLAPRPGSGRSGTSTTAPGNGWPVSVSGRRKLGDALSREDEGRLASPKNPSCHRATAPAPSGCGEASMGYGRNGPGCPWGFSWIGRRPDRT